MQPIRFADPYASIARAARFLRVPERMSVSACAERYRWLENPGGGYTGPMSFAGGREFLRRPHDCLHPDSGYSITAVQGPAQCYKSTVGDDWMLWTVVCDPADMIMLGTDKVMVGDYVVTQIDKMIETARQAALRQRQLDTVGSDNIYRKRFVGSTWFFVWPVKSQLRQRPAPRFRVDDYDAIDEDIEGEGNALTLLGGRQATFEGYEIGYVNSSPALGEDKGIEALVASGTDESWWTRCLQCDQPFPLAFEAVLDFKRDGTPEEARATACVVCPDCGHPHLQGDKLALMARGEWIGQGQALEADGSISGALRPSRIAGLRFDGLMGARSWGAIAEQCRRAELTFERAQDEGDLRAFYNTWVGLNYRSRLSGAEPVRPDQLRRRAEASIYRQRQVPPGVVFLTAAVDVQGNRFEVMIIGWGEAHQCWVIDRFTISQLEVGGATIAPHRSAEHWGVLLKHVIWRRYALQDDPEQSLPIVNTAIDTGGLGNKSKGESVTDNAFTFWHTARKAGVPATSITLVKGGNNPKARLLPPPTIDTKRRKGNEDPELFVPNVHRFKDIVDNRLRRDEPGPSHIGLPADIEPQHLDELTAERREQGVWVLQPGARNETLDLMVYNLAAVMRHGGLDGSLAWVPAWARAKRRAAGVPEITAPRIAAVADGKAAVVEQKPRPAVRRRRFSMRSGV